MTNDERLVDAAKEYLRQMDVHTRIGFIFWCRAIKIYEDLHMNVRRFVRLMVSVLFVGMGLGVMITALGDKSLIGLRLAIAFTFFVLAAVIIARTAWVARDRE
jgi:hypothetical protein